MKKYSKDDIGKVEPVEGQSCMYKLSTAFGIRKKKMNYSIFFQE